MAKLIDYRYVRLFHQSNFKCRRAEIPAMNACFATLFLCAVTALCGQFPSAFAANANEATSGKAAKIYLKANPKTIVFFIAFAPQFIDTKQNYWLHAAILIVTFTVIVAVTDSLYAIAASKARSLLATPRARQWPQRAGGGALIAAGTATAFTRN